MEKGTEHKNGSKVFQLKYPLSGRTIAGHGYNVDVPGLINAFPKWIQDQSTAGARGWRIAGIGATIFLGRGHKVSAEATTGYPPEIASKRFELHQRGLGFGCVSRDHLIAKGTAGGGGDGVDHGLAILFEIVRVLNYARLKIDISFWPGLPTRASR